MDKHDTFHALFMLRENRELINPKDRTQLLYIQMICSRIIKDSLEEIRQNSSYMSPSIAALGLGTAAANENSLKAQIGNILDFMLGIEQID